MCNFGNLCLIVAAALASQQIGFRCPYCDCHDLACTAVLQPEPPSETRLLPGHWQDRVANNLHPLIHLIELSRTGQHSRIGAFDALLHLLDADLVDFYSGRSYKKMCNFGKLLLKKAACLGGLYVSHCLSQIDSDSLARAPICQPKRPFEPLCLPGSRNDRVAINLERLVELPCGLVLTCNYSCIHVYASFLNIVDDVRFSRNELIELISLCD